MEDVLIQLLDVQLSDQMDYVDNVNKVSKWWDIDALKIEYSFHIVTYIILTEVVKDAKMDIAYFKTIAFYQFKSNQFYKEKQLLIKLWLHY